jgi:hypothetical protein
MQKKPKNEEFSAAETEKRMSDAIRRALATPHKPHSKIKKKAKGRHPAKPKSA